MELARRRELDMPSKLIPTPIALVVCDNIYEESGGKSALVGLFNSIGARTFPIAHPRLAIYVAMTSVREGMEAKVRIEQQGASGKLIAELRGDLPGVDSPNVIVELKFILNNLQFSEPGQYDIQFWVGDSVLLQRPFQVIDISSPDEGASQ